MNNDAARISQLQRELNIERAAHQKARHEIAGLRSANRRLKAMVLVARAEVEKMKAAKARAKPGAKAGKDEQPGRGLA
jgi:hypothetical protein